MGAATTGVFTGVATTVVVSTNRLRAFRRSQILTVTILRTEVFLPTNPRFPSAPKITEQVVYQRLIERDVHCTDRNYVAPTQSRPPDYQDAKYIINDVGPSSATPPPHSNSPTASQTATTSRTSPAPTSASDRSKVLILACSTLTPSSMQCGGSMGSSER